MKYVICIVHSILAQEQGYCCKLYCKRDGDQLHVYKYKILTWIIKLKQNLMRDYLPSDKLYFWNIVRTSESIFLINLTFKIIKQKYKNKNNNNNKSRNKDMHFYFC